MIAGRSNLLPRRRLTMTNGARSGVGTAIFVAFSFLCHLHSYSVNRSFFQKHIEVLKKRSVSSAPAVDNASTPSSNSSIWSPLPQPSNPATAKLNITHGRSLFGIFTHDSEHEAEMREAIRSTYLSYYQESDTPFRTCSINQLMSSSKMQQDPAACQFIYTFVIGGGDPNTQPLICLYPRCGNRSSQFVTQKGYNQSTILQNEIQHNPHDYTTLVVKENKNDGKTESFFSYAALLTTEQPHLNITLIGKLDSDTVFLVNRYLDDVVTHPNIAPRLTRPYYYGGWPVHKWRCSRAEWGRICADSRFHASIFMPGGFVFVSQLLARYAFVDGTSYLDKQQAHFPRAEDMSLANHVYNLLKPSISSTSGEGQVDGNLYRITNSSGLNIIRMPKTNPASHSFKHPGHFKSNYCKRCGIGFNCTWTDK